MKRFVRRVSAKPIIWSFVLGMCVVRGAEAAQTQNVPGTNTVMPAPPLSSSVEALAMLLQVVNRLEHYVKTKDLGSIHNEDAILGVALNGLLANANTEGREHAGAFKADLTALGQAVSALHGQADRMKQAQSEAELRNVLALFYKVRAYFTESIRTSAQTLAYRYRCPMHPNVTGKQTALCPKCGMELDQLVRVVPADSGTALAMQQTVRASVRTAGPLAAGQAATVFLRLERVTGQSMLPADLIETHTQKIHLLIIDSSLTDYHHEHPQPTGTPGEYVFSFTPRKPGGYRVWADLRPYPLGLQQYAMTDIPSLTTGEPLTDRAVKFKAIVDGLNYELFLDQNQLKVGRPAVARLRITTADGKGFTQLEPIMATFAHIVGFSEDYKTVLHMHPTGPPVLNPSARGGPELLFQIFALQPGFVRLFAQVQIDGRSRFAPFGILILP